MVMTDPVGDMLTRIRNAIGRGKESVDVPLSKEKRAIADVLKREGYIRDYEVLHVDHGLLRIQLKYGAHHEPVIKHLKRESKPGRRVYRKASDIPRVLEGLGIGIYSTSKGILSDRECRRMHVGGEYMASVW